MQITILIFSLQKQNFKKYQIYKAVIIRQRAILIMMYKWKCCRVDSPPVRTHIGCTAWSIVGQVDVEISSFKLLQLPFTALCAPAANNLQ